MRYNSPRKVSFPISEIGFGGWQLGNDIDFSKMSDTDAIGLVRAALDKGITLFDTAPGYGNGNSERLLGIGLQGRRHEVFLSTKFGHDEFGQNFSVEAVESSIKNSLKRLQTSYVDSVLLHNPGREMLYGTHPIYDELKRIKRLGLIRHFGVSIDHPEELEIVLKHNQVDVIEILFNMVHQSPKKWFEEVQKQGILLLVKAPLDSGWLTGKYTVESVFTDIRSRWTKEVKEIRFDIVQRIREIVGQDLVHAALRFILCFEGVTSVIPGVKNIKQLESNVATTNYQLTDDQILKIEELYNTYIQSLYTPW